MSELHGPPTWIEKISNDSFLTLWQNYCAQKELIEELKAERVSAWRQPPDFPEEGQEVVCFYRHDNKRKGPVQLTWFSEHNDVLEFWMPLPPCEEA